MLEDVDFDAETEDRAAELGDNIPDESPSNVDELPVMGR